MAASSTGTRPAVESSVREWLRHRKSTGDNDEAVKSSKELSSEVEFANLLHQACLERLRLLNETLATVAWSERKSRRQLQAIEIKLRLFGDSFERGKLESCLGDEEVDEKVLRFLLGIASALTQDVAVSVIEKQSLPGSVQDDFVEPLEDIFVRAKSAFDGSDTEGESTESEDSDNQISGTISRDARTFYKRCLQPLTHYVDLLMELCPTLEAIYRFKHAARVKRFPDQPIAVSNAARPYVSNVRDKFPLAAQELVNRLGEANWQRHERLRAINSADAEPVAVEAPKSVFQPVSLFRDSALGSSLWGESEKPGSTASHSSFLSSNDGGKLRLRVPKLPAGSEWGKPFPCPFCHEMIDIHNRVTWKLHVYSDLQAYVCTSNKCPEMLTLFATRKGWAQHEIDHHLSNCGYRCPSCEDISDSRENLLGHAEELHKMFIENLRPIILAKAQVMVRRPMTDVECQLCHRRGFVNDRDYATHVGKHLEEVALIALPPTTDSDDEISDQEESDEDDNSDVVSHPLPRLRINIPAQIREEQAPPKSVDYETVDYETPRIFGESERNIYTDEHEQPYKCPDTACKEFPGFTSAVGLTQHEYEFHNRDSSTKKPLFCPFSDCNHHIGHGFSRKESLHEHMRRRHNQIKFSDDRWYKDNDRSNLQAITISDLSPSAPREDLPHTSPSVGRYPSPSPSQVRRVFDWLMPNEQSDYGKSFSSSAIERTPENDKDTIHPFPIPSSATSLQETPLQEASAVKKHKCPYCSTEFTRHHNLKSHLLTHSDEKPYVCQTCKQRFRRLHDLKRHTKLHTGKEPHICVKCGRKFVRGDALSRHQKGPGGCASRGASIGSYGEDGDSDCGILTQDPVKLASQSSIPQEKQAAQGQDLELSPYIASAAAKGNDPQNPNSQVQQKSSAISSYWSASEAQDFPQILAYFGRDFERIATLMGTKTATMVKNYLSWQIESGKTELERIANLADEKGSSDEMGPLPLPISSPKQKQESVWEESFRESYNANEPQGFALESDVDFEFN